MVSIADVTDPKSIGPRIRMMRPHLTALEAKRCRHCHDSGGILRSRPP